jgi:hypothetical protein
MNTWRRRIKKHAGTPTMLVALQSPPRRQLCRNHRFYRPVAPHISRMISGEDQRYFLPISALTGCLLLSVASIFSKSWCAARFCRWGGLPH